MDWRRAVFLSLEWSWTLLGTICLGLAAAALRPAAFERMDRAAESLCGSRNGRRALAAAGIAVPLAVLLLKSAQFHSFQLMYDTGVFSNIAYNVFHGNGAWTSAYGEHSHMTLHFCFMSALLSPLLALWESSGVFAAAQGLAVGSAPAAVYLAAREAGLRPFERLLLAALCLGHFFFHDLAGSVVDDSVWAFPLFVWAAFFWMKGRRKTGIALAMLMLPAREEVPLIFLGLAAWSFAVAPTREGRARAALWAAAALALFAAELEVVRRIAAGWEAPWDHWAAGFSRVGGSPGALAKNAILRPWSLLAALFYPPEKTGWLLLNLSSFAFLPLASGARFLVPGIVWLPHQLADGGSYLHLGGHHSSFIFGPLLWASIHGYRRASADSPAPFRRKLAAFTLAATALGFFRSSDFLLPEGVLPRAWTDGFPKAAAHIPREAKVWTDEYLLPHMAMRGYVKPLPFVEDGLFRPKLFRPDRVLLSRHWLRTARPEVRDPIVDFLKVNGYRPIFGEADLVVLADPGADRRLGLPPEYVDLPTPE